MLIQINDYFRISSDSYNVMVEGRKDRKPDERSSEPFTQWTNLSYHPNIEKACTWILDRVVRDSEATDIKTLIEEVQSTKIDIIRAVGDKKSA